MGRRLLLAAWAAWLVATSPAAAWTRYICLTNTAQTSWTVPADWTNSNFIWTISGGGGASDVGPNSPGESGAGGNFIGVQNVTALSPGATVAISIGAGGQGGVQGNGTNDGLAGGSTWVCADMSCTVFNSTNVILGGHGGYPGHASGSLAPGFGADCASDAYTSVTRLVCNGGGGQHVPLFEGFCSGGAGGAGGPNAGVGYGGYGPSTCGGYSGYLGGGGGGGGNGGNAADTVSGSTGTAGATAGSGGGNGGAGGNQGQPGNPGVNGTLWAGLVAGCLGPGGGGGTAGAGNTSLGTRPDGGKYGGGGASGNNGGQSPGWGAQGAIFMQYVSSLTPSANASQGWIY